METALAIKTKGVGKLFKNFEALKDITISINKGEVYGFIGSALNLSDNITSVMEMLSPALIMNALAGYDGSSKIILALCFALVYLLSMFVFSGVFFIRQDEMNYGE